MKKLAYFLLIVIALTIGSFYLLQNENQDTSGDRNNDTHLQSANIGDTVDATNQSEVSITIDDFIFDTTVLTITEGTTVTWTNNGSAAHDVVSTDDSPVKGLRSDLLNTSESYSYTFDELGTYQYLCTPHPSQMRGTIEVVAVD